MLEADRIIGLLTASASPVGGDILLLPASLSSAERHAAAVELERAGIPPWAISSAAIALGADLNWRALSPGEVGRTKLLGVAYRARVLAGALCWLVACRLLDSRCGPSRALLAADGELRRVVVAPLAHVGRRAAHSRDMALALIASLMFDGAYALDAWRDLLALDDLFARTGLSMSDVRHHWGGGDTTTPHAWPVYRAAASSSYLDALSGDLQIQIRPGDILIVRGDDAN